VLPREAASPASPFESFEAPGVAARGALPGNTGGGGGGSGGEQRGGKRRGGGGKRGEAGGSNGKTKSSSEHSVSPQRKRIRQQAADAQEAQGVKMQLMAARAGAGQLTLVVGDIVQVGIPEADRGRADGTSLTCVVVEVTPQEMYRRATRHGVLKVSYVRGYLIQITGQTLKGLSLDGAYHDWKQLPKIALRTASLKASVTGGQGMLKCKCKVGNCKTDRCSCFLAKRLCNSRCHQNNSGCKNCED